MSESDAVSPDARPRLPRGVRLRHDEARGEWMLLGPERVLKLDGIALEILKRCDGETSFRALIADLAESFKADAAVIEKDVSAFLNEMRNRAMVEIP